MKRSPTLYFLVIFLSVFVGLGVSYASGFNQSSLHGLPVGVWCAAIAFMLNWLAFVPANALSTEKFYDLTGSLTYLSVIGFALYHAQNLDLRAQLVGAAVIIWAMRLGSFLFSRILRDGGDDRFDEIKPVPMRFFMAWTLQGLWVVLTSACAIAVIGNLENRELGAYAYLGFSLWLFGLLFEVIADMQKSNFKRNTENQGRFINNGLWSLSRHPNYFGEIVLWIGIAIVALPVLQGVQLIALISPIFVYLLITKISGVNKLEEKADDIWGDDPEYQNYKKNTPKLAPWT